MFTFKRVFCLSMALLFVTIHANASSSGAADYLNNADTDKVSDFNFLRGDQKNIVDTNYEYKEGDFPKVQSDHDELLAKKFSWWPTDAKPGPVKDPNKSGYWWWPDQPGQARPWGNQGFVYVRKIIFDYKGIEENTPKDQPKPVMRPSLVIKKIIKSVKVYFDYDRSDIRDDAARILDDAMGTLSRNPKADILVTGNTDQRGSETYNLKLGRDRAASVSNYLVQAGLDTQRIKILSQGKLNAVAPVHDLVGMQMDRNAHFVIAEVEEIMLPAQQGALYSDSGQTATYEPSASAPAQVAEDYQTPKVIEERQDLTGEIRVEVKDYVIQKGDTLWGIAKREYGDGRYWKKLYEFNQDVIKDPNKPRKGARIRIPIE